MSGNSAFPADGTNTLRQKLMVMENAVAQVTSVKNQLRINAEAARKEISNAIGHQLSLIRAREQLLLSILENVVDSKERILCEQQEQLNQAVGACQQSMECLSSGTMDVNTSMLFRISALELRPRTNSHLIFQCDPSDMRRAMCNFGQVISDPSIKDRSDCLALETEEFEDNVNLAHKSVIRAQRGFTPIPNIATEPLPASITEWLHQSRRDYDEYARNRLLSTTSSIEIISKSDCEKESGGLEAMRLSMDQWLRKPMANNNCIPQSLFPGLKRGNPKSEEVIEKTLEFLNNQFADQKPQSPPPNPQANFVKSFSDFDVTAMKKDIEDDKKSFEFESVINSIKESDAKHWLASSKKIKGDPDESVKTLLTSLPPSPSLNSGSKIEKCYESQGKSYEVSSIEESSKNSFEEKVNKFLPQITQEMSYWLKEYPTKLTDRPVNEMPDDLTPWERVLGWKDILEKLHGSGENEWLVPASRQIKTEQA